MAINVATESGSPFFERFLPDGLDGLADRAALSILMIGSI